VISIIDLSGKRAIDQCMAENYHLVSSSKRVTILECTNPSGTETVSTLFNRLKSSTPNVDLYICEAQTGNDEFGENLHGCEMANLTVIVSNQSLISFCRQRPLRPGLRSRPEQAHCVNLVHIVVQHIFYELCPLSSRNVHLIGHGMLAPSFPTNPDSARGEVPATAGLTD
jgi:hypothetical protein